MAKEKQFSSRIQNKHDIEANWIKATTFVPLIGEIIVYDRDDNFNYERIKVGDGITLVNNLPFINSSSQGENTEDISELVSDYTAHKNNTDIHLTEEDRTSFSNLIVDHNIHINNSNIHLNKEDRDSLTIAYLYTHSHSNKDILDKISSTVDIYTDDIEPTNVKNGSIWIKMTGEKPIIYIRKNDLWIASADGEIQVQVQSDWNEMDENSKAFIKNKPEIPDLEGFATKEYVTEQIESIEITEPVQSDWDERDSSLLSSIRNKPFGYKPYFYSNSELELSKSSLNKNIGTSSDITLNDSYKIGDKVTVIWDSVPYDLVVSFKETDLIDPDTGSVFPGLSHASTDFGLGNACILAEVCGAISNVEDSGEPFIIASMTGKTAIVYARINDNSTHSIIIKPTDDLIKLDSKFLPDEAISVQSDWNEIDENNKAFIKNKPIIPNFEGYPTKEYVDNAVAQKTQVQIITWEADD